MLLAQARVGRIRILEERRIERPKNGLAGGRDGHGTRPES